MSPAKPSLSLAAYSFYKSQQLSAQTQDKSIMANGLMQDPRFVDGVAIVVGGSGEIGSEICLALAAAGANVVLTYNKNKAAADDVARQIEALGRKAEIAQLHLENAEEVVAFAKEVAQRHGCIHSVVYAAGAKPGMALIADIKETDWASVITDEVIGCFNLVHATLPYFRQARDGAYVALISSAVERVVARDILSAAPKAAIEMFMRGLAKEEGANGIRVNCVSPGSIAAGADNDAMSPARGKAVKAIPLKRFGHAREVADAVLFLLSSKATYITGHSLAVDGGMQV
jgi:NAD(P)-dependent dehydrogenase (short-subunit alcohol dehydrogenase family)